MFVRHLGVIPIFIVCADAVAFQSVQQTVSPDVAQAEPLAGSGIHEVAPVDADDWTADFDQIASGQIHLVLRIHSPIAPDDVRRYARWLALSDEQFGYAWSVFEAYRRAYSKTLRDHLPELIKQSANMEQVLRNGQVYSELYLNATRELVDETQKVDGILDLFASTTFFASLREVLTEAQLEQFPRVEQDRTRRRALMSSWNDYAARIDLANMVERMSLDETRLAVVDPVLREYEQRVTPLISQVEQSLDATLVPLAEAYAHINLDDQGAPLDRTTPAGQAKHQENRTHKNAILEPAARLQADVLEVNKEFVPKILALLPEDRQRDFAMAYRQAAYPYVYPDRGDPYAIHEQLMKSKLLDPKLREVAEIEWQTHQAKWTKVSKNMELQAEQFCFDFAATEGEPHGDIYRENMMLWQAQRWDLDERFLKAVKAMLPPEQFAAIEDDVDNLLARINNARRDATERDFD